MQVFKAIAMFLIGLIGIGLATLMMNAIMDTTTFTDVVPEGIETAICTVLPIILLLGLVIMSVWVAIKRPDPPQGPGGFTR